MTTAGNDAKLRAGWKDSAENKNLTDLISQEVFPEKKNVSCRAQYCSFVY